MWHLAVLLAKHYHSAAILSFSGRLMGMVTVPWYHLLLTDSSCVVGIWGIFFKLTPCAQNKTGEQMGKYAGGDRLHLYLLSGSVSNTPAASWKHHRVICNNKQSAMSQMLSLEQSTSPCFSLFFLGPQPSFEEPHTVSVAAKHASTQACTFVHNE